MMTKVSVIVPCYNEAGTIEFLLAAIAQQSYSAGDLEVIIADGRSDDGTRHVIQDFRERHPELAIQVVDNPKRNIPAGLNQAIKAASGEYLLRLDAHSIPHQDYISRSVAALEAGCGDLVGGIWRIQPGGAGWIARSIAAAASHPLGAGDARYRVGGSAKVVDTVPFGAYHRRVIQQVGSYDETLLSNEDYEFNVRVRKAGGIIWMDPNISSIYFSRATIRALAKQYWRYGYWKSRMLLRYPETLRWRQLAGVFVISWPILGLTAVWIPLARWLFALEAALYGCALAIAGLQCGIKKKDPAQILGVPLAVATMHFSWGTAFLWSALTSLGTKKREQANQNTGG